MPDPATTKRALARLARRPVDRIADTDCFGSDATYRTVIDTADSASQRLDDAATFAETGGLNRLEDAVETAVEHGDHATARRGRRVQAVFEAFRTAAAGEADARALEESLGGGDSDHFHSGRGIPLGSGDETGRK